MAKKSKSDKADFELTMKEAYDLVNIWVDMEYKDPTVFHFSDFGKFKEMCKSEGIFKDLEDWWFVYRDNLNSERDKNNLPPIYKIDSSEYDI